MRVRNRKGNKIFWGGLFVVCMLVTAFAIGILISQLFITFNAESSREQLKVDVNTINGEYIEKEQMCDKDGGKVSSATTQQNDEKASSLNLESKYQFYKDTYGIEIPKKNLDFDKLQKEKNADIYAWLYIPGTNVDDPIVQHPTDDEYYLNHNIDGSEGYPGGIYSERCNAKDFMDRMTVIYGHNMKNGKAFGSIHNFEDTDFFEENRYIYVYTPDDIFIYEIFASYTGSSNHIIHGHEWNDINWIQYLNDTLLPVWKTHNSLSTYNFTEESKVLTLSTCVRLSPNERYLVQGVLLNEDR